MAVSAVSNQSTPARPGPLPVFKLALGAFVYPWQHRRDYVRVLAPVFLAMLALDLVWVFFEASAAQWVRVGYWIVSAALYAKIAVLCHRIVILKDTSNPDRWPIDWSKREFAFLGWMLAIYVAVFLLATVFVFLFSMITGRSGPGTFSVIVVVALLAAYFSSRYSLVLPATATDKHWDIVWAWHQSRGNGWRLALITWFVPYFLSLLIVLPVAFLLQDSKTAEIVLGLYASLLVIVQITALSLCFIEIEKAENE